MRTIISVPSKAREKLEQKVKEIGATIVIKRDNSSITTVAIISKDYLSTEELLNFQDETWRAWKHGTL